MNAETAVQNFFVALFSSVLAFVVFVIGIIVFAAASAVHCTLKEPSDRKVCWVLIILALPVIGPMCYWIFRDHHAEARSRNLSAPPPAPQRDVAAEIHSALSAEAASKRSRQAK